MASVESELGLGFDEEGWSLTSSSPASSCSSGVIIYPCGRPIGGEAFDVGELVEVRADAGSLGELDDGEGRDRQERFECAWRVVFPAGCPDDVVHLSQDRQRFAVRGVQPEFVDFPDRGDDAVGFEAIGSRGPESKDEIDVVEQQRAAHGVRLAWIRRLVPMFADRIPSMPTPS